MQILIHTDHNIDDREDLADQVSSEVEVALSQVSERVTRVEVHLSDENSDTKGGIDALRCVMEARLEGHHAIAVSHQATTLDEAVHGAADKLYRLIETTLGRLD